MTTFILYGLLAVAVVWMFRMHAGGGHGGHGGGCHDQGHGHDPAAPPTADRSSESDPSSPGAAHDHDHSRV
jgi:hypothetical protein